MDTRQIKEIMPEIIRIACKAGEKILKVKQRALERVEFKIDGSPVTMADRLAHEEIKMGIERISSLPILSEEGDLEKVKDEISKSSDELFWLVDPLDGTKEFLKELGEYTVNIALVKSNTPILGVIQAPELETVWSSLSGRGAFVKRKGKNSERIEASHEVSKIRVVASRSHFSDETKRFVNSIEKHFGQVELVHKGSSLKLCVLAEGQAEIYPRIGPTMIWDTAAGYAVAKEAGCELTDLQGQPLSYAPTGDLRQKNFIAYTRMTSKVSKVVEEILDSR